LAGVPDLRLRRLAIARVQDSFLFTLKEDPFLLRRRRGFFFLDVRWERAAPTSSLYIGLLPASRRSLPPDVNWESHESCLARGARPLPSTQLSSLSPISLSPTNILTVSLQKCLMTLDYGFASDCGCRISVSVTSSLPFSPLSLPGLVSFLERFTPILAA